ncbi:MULTISPECIES: RidA family protein [Bacillus]|uniref:Putative endoribonuclease L-PSP n=1 Tax=Bacillus amyloliquefaciens (strain Y2) TaxID=1155777 RepID=I2C1R0_BACAY|nr:MULTISPECIES: RidA family protein [Bacillus]HDR6218967.1 RidA family protein [Bacillus cereus]AFJ60584.1 putative endoribonuclease L-PSP [Bacillus velezensis YAU B9601-Y2]AJE77561.1 endoribonuclease L-PSP [Bacillus sp. BH072]ATU25724.1 reactive intermediate/imine deaminase [Bacillus velezensis]ATY27237.1 RidA family protein [Bacillus velezensis]
MLKTVFTEKAPKAIGPYSQGIKVQDFLFLSGQLPVNPNTDEVPADIREQTIQVLKNIESILKSEDLKIENIVKTTIFLKNLGDFKAVNEEYGKYLGDHRPARSTIEVSRLPKDVQIEIEVIAYSG